MSDKAELTIFTVNGIENCPAAVMVSHGRQHFTTLCGIQASA
jgi:hypothetical protein